MVEMKVGMWARLRDGTIDGPVYENNVDLGGGANVYPFAIGHRTYTAIGRYTFLGGAHDFDIVEEVPAPVPEAVADSVTMRVGMWARLRAGQIDGPVRKNAYRNDVYPFAIGNRSYTADGRFLVGVIDPCDIVEEVPPPPQAEEDPAPDLVDHPPHYTIGGVECYDAIVGMLTREELIGYLRGNSMKYRWRFRHKNGRQDLEKAEWYEAKLKALFSVD